MTTLDFITALFYEVDEQIGALPKHPEAHLWPSEVVTLGNSQEITLQRHLSASAKFAHVESRLCGHKRPGKAGFYTSTTLCVRKHVCRSVVVGIMYQFS